MKVNPKDFYSELVILGKAIDGKSALPICRAVLFTKGEIRATDLETTIVIRKDSNIEAAVNFITLRNAISALRDLDSVSISKGVSNALVITSDLGRTVIGGFNPKEFPKIPDFSFSDFAVGVKSEILRRANKFSGKDFLRPIMSGVFLGEDIVATDAYRLYKTKNKGTLIRDGAGIVIPRKVVPLLVGDLTIQTADEDAFSKCELPGGISIYWRNIDGRYPNYNAVIPDIGKSAVVATLDKKRLLSMVNSGLAVCNKTTNQAALDFRDKNYFILKVDNDFEIENGFDGKSEVTFQTRANGEGIIVGLNMRLLKDVLSVIKANDITFYLSEPNKAVIINEEFLLMPVMLND
jgi:DNA polymerase-3 subunit beta